MCYDAESNQTKHQICPRWLEMMKLSLFRTKNLPKQTIGRISWLLQMFGQLLQACLHPQHLPQPLAHKATALARSCTKLTQLCQSCPASLCPQGWQPHEA